MSDTPAAALLGLREADVVRVCGLAAAAHALDLVRAHLVTACQRQGLRLTGTVDAPEGGCAAAWLEVSSDQSTAIRWGCSCAIGQAQLAAAHDGSAAGRLGCDHVAALLTYWIRHPSEFTSPVASGAPAPPARASDAANRLATPQQLPAPQLTAHSDAPLSLTQLLTELPDAELAMVEGCVLGPEAPLLDTHEARARRVRDAVSSAAHLARMLAGLDITRARLACDIALLGGSVTRAELHGIASRSGLDRPAIDAAVRTLERHFLLVPLSGGAHHASLVTHTPRRPPDGWRIPAEILAAMDLALTADPIGKQDSTAASASTTMHGGDATAPERSPTIQRAPLQQLCTTLALLVHSPGPMHPASAGAASGGAPARPSASSASELPPELDAPPRATVAAWARMAQVPAGMARLARKVLRTLLERDGAGTALFALDRIPREEWPVALRAGFRAWLDTPSYDELSELGQDRYGVLVRCNPSQLSFQPGALADENTAARHFLIQLLARAPAGDWLPLEEMINLVWRLDPLFLRRRQRAFDTPAWWLEDARTRQPLRPDLRDEWLRGDARYCWALLSGPLHWWGVVDLATDLEGRRALRVTPLGAYLLGASDTPPDLSRSLVSAWGPAVLPAGDGAVAVQPLAAGGGLLDALAAWAHVAGVSGGRLTVRLSTDLACASFDADRDPETLLDQLRACDQRDGTHSTGALAPVLATWRGRYGQTRITHGPVVVEARDEATLAEALATAPELARRCRLVAPEVALVPVEDAPELERALARRGFVT